MEKYSLPSGSQIVYPEKTRSHGLQAVKILDIGFDVNLNVGSICLVDVPLNEECEINNKFLVSDIDIVAIITNVGTNTPIKE